MDTTHNTALTVASLVRHLTPLFGPRFAIEEYPADNHDGRDGKPVAYVEVDGQFDLYPFSQEVTCSILGTMSVKTVWHIDILVDASDPSVGIFGCEPVEHTEHIALGDAIVEIARLMAADRVELSLDREADELIDAQMQAAHGAER